MFYLYTKGNKQGSLKKRSPRSPLCEGHCLRASPVALNLQSPPWPRAQHQPRALGTRGSSCPRPGVPHPWLPQKRSGGGGSAGAGLAATRREHPCAVPRCPRSQLSKQGDPSAKELLGPFAKASV